MRSQEYEITTITKCNHYKTTSKTAHLNQGSFQSSLPRLQATGGAGRGPGAGRTPSSGTSGGPRSNRGGTGGNGSSRLPSNLN